MTTDVDDFLAHYGVKGMKWGVRNKTDSHEGRTKEPMSKKKKFAVGAGIVVGSAAVITIGAVMQSKQAEKGRAEAIKQIQAFGKKSVWELSTELPAKKNSKYSKRDVKKDTKLYGEKGRTRIEKRMNKGMRLSQARKREAARQHGLTAAKILLGVRQAEKKESAADNRILKKFGGNR